MPQSGSGRTPVATRATPEADGGRAEPLERLLVGSGSGDAEAFAELYDRLAPRVFGMVTCLLRDEDAAASTTREAFVTTLINEALRSLAPSGPRL